MLARIILVCLAALAAVAGAEGIPAYLEGRDPSFAWEVVEVRPEVGYTVHEIRLSSQTWQGIPWSHWLSVAVPDKVSESHGNHALLFIDGGSNSAEPPRRVTQQVQLLGDYAQRTSTVMALLRQVPNQPLFDDLKEDALIAYTFVQYLKTEDPSWPALLPMTRSAVAAMDAIGLFAVEKLQRRIDRFVVTGASKRGWTTWLTAAVDPRVVAIAPMVIDTLNFPAQMQLQQEAFGTYSIQIRDYTERDLPDQADTPQGRAIIGMVDPYSHRARLGLPKLIVNGTNDPYWPVDAAKLYFHDLEGEKHLHYMPNNGHAPGPTALQSISAFYYDVVTGTARPEIEWSSAAVGGEAVLTVTASQRPTAVTLWRAASATRDFRMQEFAATAVESPEDEAGRRWQVRVKLPEAGFTAAFVACSFPSALGHEYSYCTEVHVLAPAAAPGDDEWF